MHTVHSSKVSPCWRAPRPSSLRRSSIASRRLRARSEHPLLPCSWSQLVHDFKIEVIFERFNPSHAYPIDHLRKAVPKRVSGVVAEVSTYLGRRTVGQSNL